MNPVALIRAKREAQSLSPQDIETFIQAYTQGDIPDYQVSAFLMAGFLNGMNEAETQALFNAMLHSGVVVDLSQIVGIKVDKHSTGGVGDKISIPLAPIVAACGVPVPMISGRGLGHTGGTLDKLESIPQFQVNLDLNHYRQQLADIGLVMIGQTADIAPADKKLYALRDVTATVEFIPYIAGSIMSKKIASGIDALVLDVKFGDGAFMEKEKDARTLAETLVAIGEQCGKPTVARLTDMNTPLGRTCGNWFETYESVMMLRNEWDVPDVKALTLTLAAEMIYLGKKAISFEEGFQQATEVLSNGKAYAKFCEMVKAQGGSVDAIENPDLDLYPTPFVEIHAQESGYIQAIKARKVGEICTLTGAGRLKKEDPIDFGAGIIFEQFKGDYVEKGTLLARLYTDKPDIQALADALGETFQMGANAPEPTPLLKDRYWQGKWEQQS